jgi:hypothetical protein
MKTIKILMESFALAVAVTWFSAFTLIMYAFTH